MEYQALYRKYRPQRFDQVVGQDHVTATIAREVVEEKVAHAYLFAGPRGTGKTTTARLLAKALNCEQRAANGEPDETCASCVAIAAGTSLDVIELDAASHNKVEDIREIRVNVGTVAVTSGAYRIYILDEAHMLSRAAGNALLKTLEEPPDHVVFVLATTEPYKLLDTIRSRSQRFDFHPVGVETLSTYLSSIADREGFDVDPHALSLVASHAGGSVRDGLSLLEQVAALGGGTVAPEAVTHALGLADKDAFETLAAAIDQQDAVAALGLVASLAAQGADLRRFVAEAVGFFRGVFLAHYAPNLEEVADEPLETLEEWRRHAAMLAPGDVLRAVDGLSEALFELRQGREERLVVELAFLRLTRPETAPDVGAVTARLERLETRVKDLANSMAAAGPTPPPLPALAPADRPDTTSDGAREPETEQSGKAASAAEQSVPEPVSTPADVPQAVAAPEPAASSAPPAPVDISAFQSAWPVIVARVRDDAGPRRHALLKEARPTHVSGGTVVLQVPANLHFHLEQLKADDELTRLVGAIASDVLGSGVALSFEAGDDGAGGAPAEVDPPKAPDPAELLEEGDDATDPTALVVDILGGEVISD